MADEFITRQEHEEFARRMEAENARRDDENNRQNHRIDALEESVKQINKLAVSVEKMAVSTEQMAKELGKQGERLEVLEKKPVQTWEGIKTTIIAAIASGIGGAILAMVAGAIH